MHLNGDLSWTWFCIPALWDAYPRRESIPVRCQAAAVPRMVDKYEAIQSPCVFESKDTEVKIREKPWLPG